MSVILWPKLLSLTLSRNKMIIKSRYIGVLTQDDLISTSKSALYLLYDILERAGGAARVNHILKLHSPENICKKFTTREKSFLGKKPFLLKVIRRKEAPVAKRLLLENAELVWHCRLFLTGKDSKQLLKLGHLSHKRLEHLTELDTGLD